MEKIPKNSSELEIVKSHMIKVEILKTDKNIEINHAINDIVI
ncbi:MAG: hypothetical protein WCL02_07585 [bacterium]